MQHQRNKVPLRQPLQNRPIDVLYVLLEDMSEVADRLVQVKPEHESDRRHASAYHERARAAQRGGDGREYVGKDVVLLVQLRRNLLAGFELTFTAGTQRRDQLL